MKRNRTEKSPRGTRTKAAPEPNSKFAVERNLPPILPLNPRQSQYLDALRSASDSEDGSGAVISHGVAGSGKTFLPCVLASDALRTKTIRDIVISKPVVPAGRTIGLLPGDANQKMEPWVLPMMNVFRERHGQGWLDCQLKSGNIRVQPLETMRGLSLDNCWLLIDEAQNISLHEAKMILTRVGQNCVIVLMGDTSQHDLRHEKSGLALLIKMIEDQNLPVPVVQFRPEDCVRSDTCRMFIDAFDKL